MNRPEKKAESRRRRREDPPDKACNTQHPRQGAAAGAAGAAPRKKSETLAARAPAALRVRVTLQRRFASGSESQGRLEGICTLQLQIPRHRAMVGGCGVGRGAYANKRAVKRKYIRPVLVGPWAAKRE